jgi:alpha-D-xyloside xylohydrolase
MERLRCALIRLSLSAFLGITTAAYAQWTPMNPVTAVQQQTDGVLFTMGTGTLKLRVCSDSVIHVLYSRTSSFSGHPDYVIVKKDWPATKWTMQSTNDDVTLTTARLKVVVTRKDGGIAYSEADGTRLEQDASRKLKP